MKKLLKIYHEAPPAGKVALIVLTLLVLYFLYRAINKALEGTPANEKSIDAAGDLLQTLVASGDGPNYPEAQFRTWADSLVENMTGQGTDEDSIEGVFKYMQNKADVLALIKAFGIREYTDDKFLMYNIKPMNLNQWLSAEMDQAERDRYINKQLKAKNIDYSF